MTNSNESAEMESGVAEANPEGPDLTYGDIVWGQFKKNRVAYVSLWGVMALFLAAIFAPILASSTPFVWTDETGTSFPWLTTLFDTQYFENGVDLFFNLVMVMGMPMLGLWWFWMKRLEAKIPKKRPRRRKIKAVLFAGIAFFLAFFAGMVFTAVGTGDDSPMLLLRALDWGKFSGLIFIIAGGMLAFGKGSRNVLIAVLVGYMAGNVLHTTSSQYTVYSKAYWQNQADIADAEATGIGAPEAISAIFPMAPYSYRQQGFSPLEGPTGSHIMGVSTNGSDVATRILYGTRISLTIGFIAVAIYVTIGIILGSLAGYFGGKIDLAIQRLIEIVMCIPSFFLILTVIALVGSASIFLIMAAIGFVRWTGVARLVRGEFLRLRNQDFVTAAQALGFPTSRIIFQHVLPNALGPVLVAAAFGVAQAILLESSLSFLGMGDASTASWGVTLKEGYSTGAWHLVLIPGCAIFLTVLLLNLAGEGVRDAMDPKLRK
jgi:ABC-type dipeptide/oligopeptide/nickel transport system permease subunit